jgi:glycosyltransferase involved in cell wall biosynthesis
MISVITCTGFRKEAFTLCHKYMCRQTYKDPIQWIVISDDPDTKLEVSLLKSCPPNIKAELYPGPEYWREELNTQRGNMLEALKHVKGDKILVIEDDENYQPTYIEEMSKILNFVDICGESDVVYYHLDIPGWKRMNNFTHASLCQTGIKANLLPNLKAAVDSGEMYYDLHLWRRAHEMRVPCALFSDVNLSLAIKGMPGRSGIGAGHKTQGYLYDGKLVKLTELIGPDSELYKPFIRRYSNEKESKSPIVRGNESSQRKLNGQTRNDGRARGEATKQN